MNYKLSYDFNKGDNHGCGYFQVTVKNGLRCSTSVAYLKPIKNRSNLKVVIYYARNWRKVTNEYYLQCVHYRINYQMLHY